MSNEPDVTMINSPEAWAQAEELEMRIILVRHKHIPSVWRELTAMEKRGKRYPGHEYRWFTKGDEA